MRVLVVHNRYRASATSGEDVVYDNEVRLLRSAGVDVATFERDNETLGEGAASLLRSAAESLWSRRAYADLRRLLRQAKPALAHFHNLFPQISVSAYQACLDEGVPVVQTLHNFRVACLNGMLLRDGQPCEDCVGRLPWRGVLRTCYRDSFLASTAMATMLVSNRLRRAYRGVDRFIALNSFAASRFAATGLPGDRIIVRPNFLAEAPAVGEGGGGYALFAGRLGEEKGVRTLVEAWASVPELPLRIVGDGPLRPELSARATASRARVEFLGRQPHEEVIRQLQRAKFLVVPSICYENMPMVVIEAYATGTPVLASAIGSLKDLVPEPKHGMRFRPGDPDDLARIVRQALADPDWLAATRVANRTLFEERYSPAVARESALAIYRDVIAERSR